ncbi:hypothetical protein M2137_001509 [Parabacteroides sp. PFB2-10]|uniref:hypothetical protein n=1 Tax=Parabacteroides sp. PFB2-10 TaxID=1742405 RepID=UPI002476CF89|nr:hypothetical protein [Parabacteroides sp. PFB2-10]MDH6312734.1 hypothetical protein [Parabacteroides sp. PFB2-10]
MKITIPVIIAMITAVVISLYSGSTAVMFFLFFFLLAGTILALLLSRGNRKEQSDLLSIFNLGYFVYMTMALIANFAYNEIGSFYKYPDQNHFYEVASALGNSNSISAIFNLCFIDRVHIEQEGFYFLTGSLAYIANCFFDGNSVLFQIVNAAFVALLINLFIYKILLFYTNKTKAFKYTILYMFCSYLLEYAPCVLRDMHIALLFTVGIYIIHLPFSVKRLLFLFIILPVAIELRLETGFFFSVFIFVYIFIKGNNYVYKNTLYVTTFVFIGFALFYFGQNLIVRFGSINKTLVHYLEYTQDAANETDGLGKILYALPNGIKQIAITMFSQMHPFPFWAPLSGDKSILQLVCSFPGTIAPLFWFYVVFSSFNQLKRSVSNSSLMLIFLLLSFLIFLLLNSSNINTRRLVCMYPVLYAFFVQSQFVLTKKEIKNQKLQYVCVYSLLLFLYLVMKFL